MRIRWASMSFSPRGISIILSCTVYLESFDEGTELMASQIPVNKEQINEFFRRRHIRRLSLFGSVLRTDFNAQSEVDMLVEFEPEHVPGLLGISRSADLDDNRMLVFALVKTIETRGLADAGLVHCQHPVQVVPAVEGVAVDYSGLAKLVRCGQQTAVRDRL